MFFSSFSVSCLFCCCSSSLSKERLMPREMPNPTKKDPEFRSIFQHVQSPQLRRSPSELFAQHIVSIVHYIKGKVWSGLSGNETTAVWTVEEMQRTFCSLTFCHMPLYLGLTVCCSLLAAQHFPSSDMTLSERFAMYQRKAAEVEMMKPRKSPEIHRYPRRVVFSSEGV